MSGSANKSSGQILYDQLSASIAKEALLLSNEGDFQARADELQDIHTWKWLFEFAFSQFSNEGSEFVTTCIRVIKSHSNRLGYVFDNDANFMELLSTHIWLTVGFPQAPEDTEV